MPLGQRLDRASVAARTMTRINSPRFGTDGNRFIFDCRGCCFRVLLGF